MRRVAESSFAVVANGFADGPAQALAEFLAAHDAERVLAVSHPLTREDGGVHEIRELRPGAPPAIRRRRLPSRPPLTYPLDLLVPLRPPRVDAWFGFNALACAPGLAARRTGRAGTVVYWCVDYVEERFGRGLLTRAFERVDELCCRRADARFELSQSALDARDRRHGPPLAPARVVPMGAWVDRVPTTPSDGAASRRVVFLGHLVERQGVRLLLDVLERLDGVAADVIGRGPLERELREEAARRGLALELHGFVPDHREVERLLAAGSVGVAPYLEQAGSFTRFADPGKLKAYLAAGLPIVTTPVPPNAEELAQEGAAAVVPADAEALAGAIRRVLEDPDEWSRRRAAALRVARRYDWNAVLGAALESVGFVA